MPGSPLRLLLVEDNPSDARLVVHELRQAGFDPTAFRVETQAEFLASLDPTPDVVLCDYNLPQFDAMRALALLRERQPDVPFLIVSGSIGEETAVEAIKSGAADYLLKDRLVRLGPAVRHAIDERKLREAERRGREALRASEEQYRVLADSIPHIVWTAPPDGGLDYLNRRALDYCGVAMDYLTGWGWLRVVHPDDLAHTQLTWGEAIRVGEPRVFEFRLRRADGAYRWYVARQTTMRDGAGAVARWFGTCTDVHDQKEAAARLAHQAMLLANVRDAVVVTDLGGVVTYWNEGATRLFGWAAADMIGRPYADRFPEPARAEITRQLLERADGSEWHGEHEDYHKDGSRVWIDARVARTADAAGRPTGFMLVAHDITDRKRDEEVRRFQHALLECQNEASPDGVLVVGAGGRILSRNRRFLEVWDIPPGVAAGGDDGPVRALARTRAADPTDFTARTAAIELDPDTRTCDEVPLADGRTLERYSGPVRGGGGELFGRVWYFRDITARKQVEAERLRLLEQLRVQIERMPLGYLLSGPDFRYTRWNPAAERMFGFTEAEVVGKHPFDTIVPPKSRALVEAVFARQAAGDMDAHGSCENLTRDGRTITCEWFNTPLMGDDGTFQGLLSLAQDVTARRAADQALELRDRAIRAATQGLIITDPNAPDNPVIYSSPAFEHMTGYAAGEAVGRNCRFLQGKDTSPAAVAHMGEAVRAGRACTVELLNYRKDGSTFWNNLSISPVTDPGGRLTHFVAVMTDVSERRRLEAQFRQAQKMEAFGQLAGGVAHDFNNLLTVINGYGDLLLTGMAPADPLRDPIAAIREAGERAAGLTAQLLAFSRKTIIEPKVLDLNAVVEAIGKLLRRLIGEDVRLVVVLSPTLSRVRADPGQVEQVILNLAVNARDAMPTGGRLTVETADFEVRPEDAPLCPGCPPGRYVRLAVSDTGVGMTDEVQKKIFEPFFTTKEVGKGTGLGLATVYGIVTQAGGHVGVATQVGRGTTFTVLLPAVPDAPTAAAAPGAARPSRGTETVLLVEDEDAVRKLARLALETQGYKVIEAGCGLDAIRAAENHPGPIHLLVTDVVMPAMGGREVADTLRARRPELRVLYLSGYTDDEVIRYGVTEAVDAFLQKPFTPLGLARKVRARLDASG